jgi:hypothetical protein
MPLLTLQTMTLSLKLFWGIMKLLPTFAILSDFYGRFFPQLFPKKAITISPQAKAIIHPVVLVAASITSLHPLLR